MKTKFEEIYNTLQGEYQGYMQLSDKKLSKNFVCKTKQKLKPLDIGDSFVVEACFFDGDESINIRQVNDGYKVVKAKLSDFSKENVTKNEFLTNGYGKVKIATIWEGKGDEHCKNYDVLTPILQLFAGFSTKQGEEQ